MKKLLMTYNGKSLQLKNRIVMAPMTRSCAIGNIPEVPATTLTEIRKEFKGTLIHCNGFTAETAEIQLQNGDADLIAFGRSFLANPDFVERIIAGSPLDPVDYSTLYTPGVNGYIDYPVMTGASEQTVI